jgi:hypothetical protein
MISGKTGSFVLGRNYEDMGREMKGDDIFYPIAKKSSHCTTAMAAEPVGFYGQGL